MEFLRGTIEDIPLPDDSVDVIISNCVINLSANKSLVFREAARVLRPGGRFAVTDIVADADMPESVRLDIEQWSGCIGGALTPAEFERGLTEAGFDEFEIRETSGARARRLGDRQGHRSAVMSTTPEALSLKGPSELYFDWERALGGPGHRPGPRRRGLGRLVRASATSCTGC